MVCVNPLHYPRNANAREVARQEWTRTIKELLDLLQAAQGATPEILAEIENDRRMLDDRTLADEQIYGMAGCSDSDCVVECE